MDIIFDIDGTLADPSHRLHLIKDMAHWVSKDGKVPKPNWEEFLSVEQISKDTPIVPIWNVLTSLLTIYPNRILFMTGRDENKRKATMDWLTRPHETLSEFTTNNLNRAFQRDHARLLMRNIGDRRHSREVKRTMLWDAVGAGFKPLMAFDDRAEDIKMYRSHGLIGCQVNEGDF